MSVATSENQTAQLLRKALFEGEYDEFDALVQNYKQSFPQDKDLSQLFLSFATPSIFGFRSLSTDIMVLRKQRSERELKVLETFANPLNQLWLLVFDIEDITQEHIKRLSPVPHSFAQKIKDRVRYQASNVLLRLFEEHQFDCCVLLEKLYNLSWRDPTHQFYFSYKTKNTRGRFVCTPKNASVPRFHLAGLCFSPQTKKYLLSQGIKEDEFPQCLYFIDDCTHMLENPSDFGLVTDKDALKACLDKIELSKSYCLQSVLSCEVTPFLPQSKPTLKKSL